MKFRVTAVYERDFDLDGEMKSYCEPGDTPEDVLEWIMRDDLIKISDIEFEAEFIND